MSPERAFWAAAVRLAVVLLVVWAAVAYGLGVILRPALDVRAIAGVPAGEWVARNGAVVLFALIVVFFVVRVAALERRHFGDGDS